MAWIQQTFEIRAAPMEDELETKTARHYPSSMRASLLLSDLASTHTPPDPTLIYVALRQCSSGIKQRRVPRTLSSCHAAHTDTYNYAIFWPV